jgi:hypothetical protein
MGHTGKEKKDGDGEGRWNTAVIGIDFISILLGGTTARGSAVVQQ